MAKILPKKKLQENTHHNEESNQYDTTNDKETENVG